MSSSKRRSLKPSYSSVVATLALFIALGGSSYAALKLPKNSVGTREVRDHSLLTSDLAHGVLPPMLRGPRGPEGPEGGTGASGAPGPPGATSILTASRGQVELSANGPSATDLISLTTVPAGNWWVIGSASMVWGSPNSASDWFRCEMLFGATAGGERSVARVGSDAGAALAANLVVQQGRTLTAPTRITMRCGHDAPISGGNPRIDHVQLTAIRADTLDLQDG